MMVISFSGPDGSGKTSQVQALKKTLLKMNQKVKIVHIGGGPKLSQKQNERFFPSWLTFLKDYWQIVFSRRCKNADFLIFDRYLYDTLVKTTYRKQTKTFPRLFVKLTQLIPLPDMAILFLADPEITYRRDQDHSRQYHRQKNTLYQKLADHFSFWQIDAHQPKEKISLMIAKKIKAFLVSD